MGNCFHFSFPYKGESCCGGGASLPAELTIGALGNGLVVVDNWDTGGVYDVPVELTIGALGNGLVVDIWDTGGVYDVPVVDNPPLLAPANFSWVRPYADKPSTAPIAM